MNPLEKEIPDVSEIPILDGEECDLSFAIDQYHKNMIPNKISQVSTTADADNKKSELFFLLAKPT
jgi:hypothetical protein